MLGILLQAGGASGAGYGNLILIGGIIVIFYFFMIRPQQKKQKDQKKFMDEIKKGDSVVTMGGIHGKVAAVENDTVLLEVDRSTKITVEKTSISLEASKRYLEPKK
jgi:preprotein translocase subunit YajC